jgi:predicted nuclease of predicted toxin-antitoxin system
MKFLFDQNISHRILQLIPDTYSDSTTVKKERLINASDREIWEYAKSNDYIIVTQDSDFNDLNSLYGFPPKIIWIRTGNLKTQSIADILIDNIAEIKKFINDSNYGCFEVFSMKSP